MPTRTGQLIVAIAALAPVLGPVPAAAEESEAPSVMSTSAVAPRSNPLGLTPLDAAALARKRGGMEVVNEMRLRGIVADNEARNLMTGNNTISGGAFDGAAGLPMVIQNSGNNVLIQNATIVNVQVK